MSKRRNPQSVKDVIRALTVLEKSVDSLVDTPFMYTPAMPSDVFKAILRASSALFDARLALQYKAPVKGVE